MEQLCILISSNNEKASFRLNVNFCKEKGFGLLFGCLLFIPNTDQFIFIKTQFWKGTIKIQMTPND